MSCKDLVHAHMARQRAMMQLMARGSAQLGWNLVPPKAGPRNGRSLAALHTRASESVVSKEHRAHGSNGKRSHPGSTRRVPEPHLQDMAPGSQSTVSTSSMDGDSYQPVGTAEFASDLTTHPILQLIHQRASTGSRPGQRAPGDKFKLGLVVEGGGMRGIVSGAMLMALHALGLQNAFDACYGASAGAINLTYFLSGQRKGLDVYTEDLSGSQFINLSALLKGEPAMKLDYLLDHVMNHVKPLDWHSVLHSPLPLKVVASSLDSLRPVLLEGWSGKQDLVECLKATATVPQIAGHPRMCRGHRLVDAAIFEPVPVRTALRDGCTHVLVLCTRPATLHTTWRKVVRGTVVRVVKRTVLNAPYMRAAWSCESSDQLASQDEELVNTLTACPHETFRQMGAYVLPIYPEHTGGCSPVTSNPDKLKKAEAEGWKSIAKLFGCNDALLSSWYGSAHPTAAPTALTAPTTIAYPGSPAYAYQHVSAKQSSSSGLVYGHVMNASGGPAAAATSPVYVQDVQHATHRVLP